MQIELSPADASYISELVKNGYFPTEEEAVAATISNAREQYESKRRQLGDALQSGMDAIEAGRYTEYTPELLDELFDEAMAEEEQGVPLEIDPDVRGANSLLIFQTLPKRISKASLDTLYVLSINLPLY